MPAVTSCPTIPCLRTESSRGDGLNLEATRRVHFTNADDLREVGSPRAVPHEEVEYDLGCLGDLSPWSGTWAQNGGGDSDQDDDDAIAMCKVNTIDGFESDGRGENMYATSPRITSRLRLSSSRASVIKNTFIHVDDASPAQSNPMVSSIRTEPVKIYVSEEDEQDDDQRPSMEERRSFGRVSMDGRSSYAGEVSPMPSICKIRTEDGFEPSANNMSPSGYEHVRSRRVRLHFGGEDGAECRLDDGADCAEQPGQPLAMPRICTATTEATDRSEAGISSDSDAPELDSPYIDFDGLEAPMAPPGVLGGNPDEAIPAFMKMPAAPPGVFSGCQAPTRPTESAAAAASAASAAASAAAAAYNSAMCMPGLPAFMSMPVTMWPGARAAPGVGPAQLPLAGLLGSPGAFPAPVAAAAATNAARGVARQGPVDAPLLRRPSRENERPAAAVVPARLEGPLATYKARAGKPIGWPVKGRVWALSQDATGCREVQAAFDTAEGDEERAALASELRGHVWEALHGPHAKHANHVVQKCALTVRPQALQFIVDEIAEGGFAAAAKNKYGCRVVKRLLDRGSREQVRALVEALLADGCAVSQHPYGNYVMQHLLKSGLPDQRRRLFTMLRTHIRGLSSDLCGCAVVSAALSEASDQEEQVELARAILREPGLLVFLACTQHGHQAVRRALELFTGDDLQDAQRQLGGEAAALGASRYGRQVVACVEAYHSPRGAAAAAPRSVALSGEQRQPHGSVWELSQDALGCRDVQRALEEAPSDEERKALAEELHGHVWEALRCPHANHVIQKLIATAQAGAFQFVVDELAQGDVVEAAQHKYGSRIVQRVIEQSDICQVSSLIEALLARCRDLARHAYGNYVVQHLLEHGTPDHRHRLIQAIEGDLCELSTDPYGCAVASASLCYGAQSDRARLTAAILSQKGLLTVMAGTRHGHVAVKRILGALDGEPLEAARKALSADRVALSSSRYGRSVLASLGSGDTAAKGAPGQ